MAEETKAPASTGDSRPERSSSDSRPERSDRGPRGPRPGGGPGGSREGGRKYFRRKKVCKFCTTRTCACSRGSSPRAGRSFRGDSQEPARDISAGYRRRSSRLATSRCCRSQDARSNLKIQVSSVTAVTSVVRQAVLDHRGHRSHGGKPNTHGVISWKSFSKKTCPSWATAAT
jgi:hypothetical protein